MRTEKQLSKNRLFFMICAVMLMVASVVTVSSGVEAKVSILSTEVTYNKGIGPDESKVTTPQDAKDTNWDLGKHNLSEPKCTDENFTFMYWVKDGDSSETPYSAGASYEVEPNDTTLSFTAIWGVKISFDANTKTTNASVTVPGDLVARYGTEFSLDDSAFLTDSDFLGWSVSKDAKDAKYTKTNNKIPADSTKAPLILYAVWNGFTVTYHANTGNESTDSAVTGIPSDSTKYVGENLTATVMGNGKLATNNANYGTMKDGVPTRTGFTFAGWATTQNATKAEYQPGDTIGPLTKDIDLYAVWTSGTAATTGGTTSGTSTAATSTTKTPQTGDNDHFFLYIVMAVLSLAGIGYLCYDLKKAKATK